MENIVLSNEIINNYDPDGYVYDICLDGTLVNALGNNVVTQTDGFNYAMPPQEELDGRVYVGKGLNRNTVDGKTYYGVEADVMEFSDLFLRGKMGLGIDEYADSSINFSRKNYADLFENNEIKYVGNSIKSKKMPVYIEKFLATGIVQLLKNQGKEFLENYYDYIEKIYNYEIPLREIASKGKIKQSISDYVEDCKTITKAGRPKNRQVWYELCLKDGFKPDIGDTIYYINTGDGKKKTTYKDVEKKTIKNKEDGSETFELLINCVRLDRSVVEAEDDTFCDGDIAYNAPKYIEQFNKRITPLLVCFHPDIRNNILIKTPNERKFFTEKESKLTAGYPNKEVDQDTYEKFMTMEDKEIKFWKSINEEPPFAKECGMDWSEIISKYDKKQELYKQFDIETEIIKFNEIINNLTEEDVEKFVENPKLPKELSDFVKVDNTNMDFISKEHGVVIGNIYDIIDKEFVKNEVDDIVEN